MQNATRKNPKDRVERALLLLKGGQILVTHDKKFNSLSKVQIEKVQISVW
jgi:hypothetical protein